MSISAVANMAGVGTSTVSRFINGKKKVSLEAANRIEDAISRIGYVAKTRRPGPKTMDRKGISTGVVHLLFFTRHTPEELQKMALFPRLFSGIQSHLMKYKMTLMINYCHSGNTVPEMLNRRFCDGVIAILMGTEVEVGTAILKKLREFPTVWCFRRHADPQHTADHVLFNNSIIGRMAAEYLHKRGHSSVVSFNQFPDHEACDEREECFRKACQKLGMTCKILRPEKGALPPKEKIYGHLAEAYLELKSKPSGAFFCVDDTMLGVGIALGKRGYGFSGLDLLGCNNDDQFLRFFENRPASIDIRIDEIGQLAVSRLMSRINGANNRKPVEIILDPEIVKGED